VAGELRLKPLANGSTFQTYPFLKRCIASVRRGNFRNLYFVTAKLTFVKQFLVIFDVQNRL